MNKPDTPNSLTLLTVDHLEVIIPTPRGPVHAVDDVSFALERGKTLGLVGESGCGKSMLCRAILGLLPREALLAPHALIRFDGQILNRLPERALSKIRGRDIAMVFQDPMTSLNPVMKIGRQVAEPLVHHMGMKSGEALDNAVELMRSVGIANPEQRLRQYPHQLSGGLRQRVAIATSIACEPKLLIADEPTTALDVTVQAEILDLLDHLRSAKQMAMILVTHDLGVAAGRTQSIAVMYGGKIVETAATPALFAGMRVPYTRALFDSIPRLQNPPHTMLATIEGQPPNLIDPPGGCRFAPRCARAQNRCFDEQPPLLPQDPHSHRIACWFPLNAT